MKIGDLVKEYRRKNNLTMQEFANMTRLSKGYISMLEKGRHPQNNRAIVPSIETVKSIATAMNVSVDDILEMLDNNQLIDISHKHSELALPKNAILPSAKSIPIMGTICAGDGVVCEDDYSGNFIIDTNVTADYCLKVHGDSMQAANIYDGDLVFIKKDYDIVSGRIYAVENLNTHEASLKKVTFDNENIILIPCNPEYQAVVSDYREIRIAGECVGVFHRY